MRSRVPAVGCALGLLLALAACAADPPGSPAIAENRRAGLNDTADCHDQARWQAEQQYPTRVQGIRNKIETTNELGRFSEEVQVFKRCLQHKAYWP